MDHSQSDTVSRIDPRGRRLIETIRVGDHPTGIAIGDGSVWAANSEDDTVTRIDADTNRVIDTIPVGDRPMFIRYGTGGLWVPNAGDGTLVRIGPDINEVADAPLELGRGIDRVAIGGDGLWISNPDADEVTRVEFIPRRRSARWMTAGGSRPDDSGSLRPGADWLSQAMRSSPGTGVGKASRRLLGHLGLAQRSRGLRPPGRLATGCEVTRVDFDIQPCDRVHVGHLAHQAEQVPPVPTPGFARLLEERGAHR